MIHNIREAFNELLADIHWMDNETRAVAKEKANAMNERIGYPEILTDDEELEKEYGNVCIHQNLEPFNMFRLINIHFVHKTFS